MSPAAEIALLVSRELRRSVRSVKGIVIGILTLLGAVLTSLVCIWVEGSNRHDADAMSNEAYTEVKKTLLEKTTNDASLAAYMASIPTSLFIFLKATVWLGPLLVALLGFDTISGELQYRSVRFWTVRSRRWSYFAGKFLGLWALIGIITLVLNVLASGVALARGYVTVGQLFEWVPRFWFIAFLIAGTWAAIATFISSCFKTPILALLTTFATFFVLWLFDVGGLVAHVRALLNGGSAGDMVWYEYLYPSAYDTMLLAHEATKVLTAIAILVGFMAAMAAFGSFLFQRRDV